jgi:hypothetical protein
VVVEEVLSMGRLRLMPLLVVVVAFEESVGFFSACSFAWSFFQLLDRSVVGAGMTYGCIAVAVAVVVVYT